MAYKKSGFVPPSESEEIVVESGECIAPERVIKEAYFRDNKLPSFESMEEYEEWKKTKKANVDEKQVNVEDLILLIEMEKKKAYDYTPELSENPELHAQWTNRLLGMQKAYDNIIDLVRKGIEVCR